MKIIVTGKGGQLASELEKIKKMDVNWTFLSEHELDITDNEDVKNYFSKNECNLIVNCAAYTAVDKAEDEPEQCFLVNETGVRNLLNACQEINAKLIHFSTDYVFDGNQGNPYTETDTPNPQGIYGKSKLAGERVITEKDTKSIIIRTAWVYSNYGDNFVKTMLRLESKKESLGVVSDQFGSPTFAADLASATIKIIEDTSYQWKVADLFHYSNEGSCSWFDFAKEVFKILKSPIELNALSTKEYPTKATRPKYSLLNKEKLKKTFNIEVRHWHESLEQMLLEEKRIL